MTFAANHIGHFALTKALLDVIANTPESRVVVVSSGGHNKLPFMEGTGLIYFDDINFTSHYSEWPAYS
jgi:protochlorophyllide reductase